MAKPGQIKQIWFTQTDQERFERIAARLKAQGVDVEPDNRKATDPYSYTKVVRVLLEEADEKLLR